MELISIVVPAHNEEETVKPFMQEMYKIAYEMTNVEFEYIFVNDGSTDKTKEVLEEAYKEYGALGNFHYINFSRNFGKESAMYAGFKKAKGDYIVVMDADLQDPPEMIKEMYRYVKEEDYDVVGTMRTDRTGEPKIRSWFSDRFYEIINKISDTPIIKGARDFRLMKRKVVQSILELPERNRFSKGLFTWVGYKTKFLPYENHERVAGTTSWSFWSLFKYSIDGIVAFSNVPLYLSSFLGVITMMISVVVGIFMAVRKIIFPSIAVDGWTSLILLLLFIGGSILLMLGIMGIYLGKIFEESKQRPLYIIDDEK